MWLMINIIGLIDKHQMVFALQPEKGFEKETKIVKW